LHLHHLTLHLYLLCGAWCATHMQALFLRHVSADTLLVGHGLENDLRALKVLHGR
jgi:hypothetical protein